MMRERKGVSSSAAHSLPDDCQHDKVGTDKSAKKNRKAASVLFFWKHKIFMATKQQAFGWTRMDLLRRNILLVWISLAVFLLILLQNYFAIPATAANGSGGPAKRFRRLSSFSPDKFAAFSTAGGVPPPGKWPFTLKDHPEQFEKIIHPGNNHTQLMVPKFWTPPIHNNKLMTRGLAMKVGTCAKPDARGNVVRGEDCPLDQRTIFITVASYRDFQCRETIESMMTRAFNPHRIRISVVDQIIDGIDVECDAPIEPCNKKPEQALCRFQEQIDVFQLDAPLSLGPTFARNLGYRMYRGEYYALQTDAHISFVQDWDKDIISQFESTKNEMAVLTTYLSDIRGSIDEKGHSKREGRPIMCNSDFEEAGDTMIIRHKTQPESDAKVIGSPQLEVWWAAGFSFSRGHFIVNVPYDQYQTMVFQGEEMTMTIRAFTIGYDFYTPERSVCFHWYEREDKRIKYYGENDKKYDDEVYNRGMRRVVGVVRMSPEVDPKTWDHIEEEFYGLGGVRTPEKFYKVFGIDVVNKVVQHHMCKWVDSDEDDSMHNQFTPFLRSDGMGIDYEKIDFEFTDPTPNMKDDDEAEEEESESESAEEEESESQEEDEEEETE